MKILAIDIGAGTEDVLLFDDEKKIENCVKMVLPSPSRVYAEKVREMTRLHKNIFVKGDIIGGGNFASAIRNHVKEGLRVLMTENSAYTIRNDPSLVRKYGIEVGEDADQAENSMELLLIEEVNIEKLKVFLTSFNEDFSDIDFVAVAVQDHGVSSAGMSNRKFRIEKMRKLLKNDPRPESLAFMEDEIPQCFFRMRSAVQASRKQLPETNVLVMDTAPAAILGCLSDSVKLDSLLAVNVGNSHTMAALVANGRIVGLVEHHTALMNREKIVQLLASFADGKLTNEEVFDDGGHGLFFLEDLCGFSELERIVATGPNRRLLEGTDLNIEFASPAGDMMMTGPVGLVKAVHLREEIDL